MAAGHTFSFKLLKFFIILALLDCKTYSTRPYIVPKDSYSKDIHRLNADGLLFGLFSCEYILPAAACVVIRRLNLESHFAVSFVLTKQTKHGTTCLALPSRPFVIDLTVHVDISPNPGPDAQCKSEYGKSDDKLLSCATAAALRSIRYSRTDLLSPKWLAHNSLPYISTTFSRSFEQFQMSGMNLGKGQRNPTRHHQKITSHSVLNTNEHWTNGQQYPIQTRITTQSRNICSYYKRPERNNLIKIACTRMVPSFKPSLATHFCLLNTRSLKNKGTLVHDYIVDRKVDILALTETWLSPGNVNEFEINETTPNGYAFLHAPRHTRGGEVAVVYRKSLHLKQNPTYDEFKSFEHMDLTVKSASKSLRIIVIYRPPPSKNNNLTESTFFSEFSTLLEELVPYSGSGSVLIAGDFNFHVNDSSNASAKKFLNLLTSFDYRNHVLTATHKKGHTLDLLLTRSDDKFVSNIDVIDPEISDHSAVNCKLLLAKPPSVRKQVSFRNTKAINFDLFRTDIKNSSLLKTPNTSTLAESYQNVLSTLLDTYAPVKTKTVTLRPATPWYTPEIQEQKIRKRRLERRWRTTKLTVDREVYTQQCIVVNRTISAAKTNYYKDMINDCGSDQGELFKKIDIGCLKCQ